MKYFSKFLSLIFASALLITACSKVDNLHKVEPLAIYQPGMSPVLTSSLTTVSPALADSNNAVIAFNWTNPKYANDSSTTKYVLEIDTAGGTFLTPATKTINGALSTAFIGRELNAILVGLGYPVGTAKSFTVRVISSYANNNERYVSNELTVNATVFADPATLSGSATSVSLSLANAGQAALDFSWTKAFQGFNGAVTYMLEYDSAGRSFATARQVTLNPADQFFKTILQGDLNTAALAIGIIGGTTGTLEYRIKAMGASNQVVYSNTFVLSVETYFPVRRFYMAGDFQSVTGNGNDWDPPTGPEFIRDLRPGLINDMYYMYIYLPTGKDFKITQGRSWDINYGGSGGVLSLNGNNLTVPASGFYRVSFNATALTYDIREGRMGFVGGATGAGWNPPNVFPAYRLGNAGTNLFVGLADLAVDGWKLIDNDQWNSGSNTVDETRSYGAAGGPGSTLEINGANFSNPATAGRYRVIWDGRDRDNVKYDLTPGTEMRLVGDGIDQAGVNEWDPPSSPQMTYMGSGVWTLTVNLKANKDFKFVAGNAWGAFDYEDNSGGSTAVGAERKIKWEGGDNFKTPTAAGTYTITLDENNQTATIN